MSQRKLVPQAIFTPGSEALLNSAFDLLARAIGELAPSGTPVKAAAIKPTMQRLGFGSFDEKELNYENFRSFLQDAAARGVIVLDTKTDQDYLVSSASAVTRGASARPAQNSTPLRPGQRRVRQDLWSAFIDWRQGLIRLYDVETGQVHMIPSEPSGSEPEETAGLRQARLEQPQRYREIKPITFEEQVGWMKEFSRGIENSELADVLRAGFTSDRPAAIFRTTIRTNPALDEGWRAFLLDKVVIRIREWAEDQHLELNPFSPPPPAQQAKLGGPTTNPENTDQLAALRSRLHAAIDNMPLHELMQIRIPVGYLPLD